MLLRFDHGMGDAVAFTAVLAHLKKRGIICEFATREEYAPMFEGLVSKILSKDTPGTKNVQWLEGRGLHDWCPTKTARCLVEEFKINPEPELLKYRIDFAVHEPEAIAYLDRLPKGKGVVAIHYEGVACPQKNMPVEVVAKLCSHLIRNQYLPLLLDWTERPKLADNEQIFCPGRGHLLWEGKDHADPCTLAALLSMTALNVMIDSGPGKLAMATKTPLICAWPGSSPIHYVDSPEIGIHLVGPQYEQQMTESNGVNRECDPQRALAFFRSKFRHQNYTDMAKSLIETVDHVLGLGGVSPIEPTGETVPVAATPAAPPVSVPGPITVSAHQPPRKLLLHSGLPPGDIMTMTAAVHVLHEQHPGKYLTAISTGYPEIWENNPHVVPMGDHDFEKVDMQYHAVNESGNRPVHFIQGYAEMLFDHLKLPFKMTTNRPWLYLSQQEIAWMNQVHQETGNNSPYWVVNAGVKSDYTSKQYHAYQEVVDLLRGKVRFVQVGLESDRHRPLRGAVNLIGKTSVRALIRLIYHAQGVLSGVSFAMHIAAAFDKPAVIVAGGREPRLWNSYPCQTLLANVGSMDCCRNGGCWRSKVLQTEEPGAATCAHPMPTEPPAGECMTKISPQLVASAIESYLP